MLGIFRGKRVIKVKIVSFAYLLHLSLYTVVSLKGQTFQPHAYSDLLGEQRDNDLISYTYIMKCP